MVKKEFSERVMVDFVRDASTAKELGNLLDYSCFSPVIASWLCAIQEIDSPRKGLRGWKSVKYRRMTKYACMLTDVVLQVESPTVPSMFNFR